GGAWSWFLADWKVETLYVSVAVLALKADCGWPLPASLAGRAAGWARRRPPPVAAGVLHGANASRGWQPCRSRTRLLLSRACRGWRRRPAASSPASCRATGHAGPALP